MSKLSAKARKGLSASAFVFPGERRYPIHDRAHARNALARSAGKAEEGKVRAAVHSRFPDIGEKTAAIVKYTEKGKLVKKAQYSGFSDELEKISKSFVQNLGTKITRAGYRASRWAGKQPIETAAALKDHLQPVKMMQASWNKSKWMGMKGLTVAGAGLEGASALPKQDPEGRNRGRGERLGKAVAGTASGLITMRHGFIPALATGVAAGYAGGKIGKQFDRMKKHAPGAVQAPPPEST